MRKFTVLFLLLYNLSFGQDKNNSIFIAYEEKIVVDETKFTTVINAYLLSNGKESLYEEDFKNNAVLSKTSEDNSKTYTIPSDANTYYYKNADNLITYYDFINYGSDFYINDKIEFDWIITENTKEILGYVCQEAKTDFRGRRYVAYFASKIPVDIGPWKFHALPGAILEIKSIDGAFQAIAKKIELKNEFIDIVEPYKEEKKITFNEFKRLYKKKYDEVMAYRPEEGTTVYMPKRRTETLILF